MQHLKIQFTYIIYSIVIYTAGTYAALANFPYVSTDNTHTPPPHSINWSFPFRHPIVILLTAQSSFILKYLIHLHLHNLRVFIVLCHSQKLFMS